MDAFSMGDHGAFIGSAYGITLLVLVLNEWRARVRHRKIYRDVEVRIKTVEDRL